MAYNYWWTLAFGTLSFCLAYCIYFDHKRLNDPDYKKGHMRRQKLLKEKQPSSYNNYPMPLHLQSADRNALEQCFVNEIQLGEQLLSSGKLSEGLGQLANAIMVCAQPMNVLQTLKETLPDRLFRPLVLKLQELHEQQLAGATQSGYSDEYPDQEKEPGQEPGQDSIQEPGQDKFKSFDRMYAFGQNSCRNFLFDS